MEQRIIIPLYKHTTNEEILDLFDAIKGAGIDDLRLERKITPRKTMDISHDELRTAVKIAADIAEQDDAQDVRDTDQARLDQTHPL